MNSDLYRSRAGAAVFAVGLGLAVAANPGVAVADESDSRPSSQAADSASAPGSESDGDSSGSAVSSSDSDADADVDVDADGAEVAAETVDDADSAVGQDEQAESDPVEVLDDATVAIASETVDSSRDSATGSQGGDRGVDLVASEAVSLVDDDALAYRDAADGAMADLEEAVDADLRAASAGPRTSAPSPAAVSLSSEVPAASVAPASVVEDKPTGIVSGLLSAFRIAPAAAGSDAPAAPTSSFTLILEAIRREINRLFNNKAPTAAPAQTHQSADGVVTGSLGASDPEGDPLRYTVTQAPERGSVIVDAAGNFTYTPGAGLAATGGADTFVVQVRDVGFRLNWWSPTRIQAPVTVTITAPTNSEPNPEPNPTSPGTPNPDPGQADPGDLLWGEAYFAPYVDMAGWPVPDLMGIARDYGVSLLTLGFVQAAPDGEAAWGGYATLAPGSSDSQAQSIDSAIAAFKAAGGDVMVSFGGAAGTTLAQWHAQRGLSAQQLADVYIGVVDAYGLNRVDFDIEGHSVAEPASIALRSEAIALLQQARPELEVWYTLPVLPSGLTHDGVNVVDKALEAGVTLDGVNVMAMDYGESAAPTTGPNAKSMGAYAILAAQSTYGQMSSLFAQHGQQFEWNQLGVTPMIGVNDVLTEIFTVADAQALEDFARTNGVGMLSMWSVTRDRPGSLGQASPTASGLNIPAGSFSNVWNDYGTINEMNLGSTPGGGTGGGGSPVEGGTTTLIGWHWGATTVLDFDPPEDKLDFGWMQPANFEVTEQSGSTKIIIVDSGGQTYTLNGVALNQMTIGNIVALDTNTVTKWQTLINNAGPSTPTANRVSCDSVLCPELMAATAGQ